MFRCHDLIGKLRGFVLFGSEKGAILPFILLVGACKHSVPCGLWSEFILRLNPDFGFKFRYSDIYPPDKRNQRHREKSLTERHATTCNWPLASMQCAVIDPIVCDCEYSNRVRRKLEPRAGPTRGPGGRTSVQLSLLNRAYWQFEGSRVTLFFLSGSARKTKGLYHIDVFMKINAWKFSTTI